MVNDGLDAAPEPETTADPCTVCEHPSDTVYKGESYCTHHYERRIAREALW